jgi:sortase A
MRDKRQVEELSIDELEQVLAIRKRRERETRMQRLQRAGRVVAPPPESIPLPESPEMRVTGTAVSVEPPTLPLPTTPMPLPAGGAPQFEDDGGAAYTYAKPTPTKTENPEQSRFWRRFTNQLLLLIEVAAIGAIAILGYQMFTSIGRLEEETSAAQELANQLRQAGLPTLVPTPQIQLINDVVLPGGHTFDSSGQALPNFEEVPAALRSALASQFFAPLINAAAPITPETALWIDIPSINVGQAIVPGTDWEALKQGVGQLLNGVRPGDEAGNLVLSAHNDIYGSLFQHLDQLQVGDEFTVRTQSDVFTYRITETQIVNPNDVHVMSPRGGATATLISCYPYKVNNKRYIVFAERVNL